MKQIVTIVGSHSHIQNPVEKNAQLNYARQNAFELKKLVGTQQVLGFDLSRDTQIEALELKRAVMFCDVVTIFDQDIRSPEILTLIEPRFWSNRYSTILFSEGPNTAKFLLGNYNKLVRREGDVTTLSWHLRKELSRD